MDTPLSTTLQRIGLFLVMMSALFWVIRGPAATTGQLIFRIAVLGLGFAFAIAGYVVGRMEK